MRIVPLVLLIVPILISRITLASPVDGAGGRKFICFTEFKSFERTQADKHAEIVLTSPEIDPGIGWDEMVVSWNAEPSSTLRIEAKSVYPDHDTKWYVMGLWSADPSRAPRESVVKQKDEDGDVETDTLVMKRIGGQVLIRVTFGVDENGRGGEGESRGKCLRFLGLSFLETKAKPTHAKPNRKAWGRELMVPEKSQLAYSGGNGWCSPASSCMVMDYWAKKLNRTELAKDVPEVAAGVNDPNWPGTGNWPFNTAYAGSFSGMRAYVTRLADISELEDWIAAGIPVVCSVSYRLLHEKGKSDGHVVVCTGFTKEGDVIINDPWCHPDKGERPRCVCPRVNMVKAWVVSKNTVYLIYPQSIRAPNDKLGHWAN
jgi:uncharacterized protein YvpB